MVGAFEGALVMILSSSWIVVALSGPDTNNSINISNNNGDGYNDDDSHLA